MRLKISSVSFFLFLDIHQKHHQNYSKKTDQAALPHKSGQGFQALIKLLHLLQQNISFLGSQANHYVRGLFIPHKIAEVTLSEEKQ